MMKQHCESCLLTIKFYHLDHLEEDSVEFVSVQFLDAAANEHMKFNFERAYWTTSSSIES